MSIGHDFNKFPELTNNQMQFYYFDSPHKQITENFMAQVIKVTDGDTIRVKTDFRSFDFPIRVAHIDAPELNDIGGRQSRDWLAQRILNTEVEIIIDKFNRVGKFGRLIGDIFARGMRISEESQRANQSGEFGLAQAGQIPLFQSLEVFLK